MKNLLKGFLGKLGSGGEKGLAQDLRGKPVDRAVQLAVAALFIESSGADENIAQEEAETLISLLIGDFALDENTVLELVAEALEERKASPKIDAFVATVNSSYSPAQRALILERVWTLVLADGKVEKIEKRFAVQLQYRFQLDAAVAQAAQERAQARIKR